MLAGTAALAVAPLLPYRAALAGAEAEVLKAAVAQVQIAPEGYPATEVWGYGGVVPSTEIRLRQGGRLQRRLVNTLPEPTTVHWHGIRLDNAMDGVPGVTQEAVPPGGEFAYAFDLPDAGTYWYHSHNQSYEQVARGLHGPLIVEEADAPDVDRDQVIVLDDFRLDPETGQIAGFANMMDFSHGGRLGNIVVTNGRFNHSMTAKHKERLRLRLINAANAKIFELALEGLEGWIVALDGMPLDAPEPISETFLLAPAQRADLIVDVTADVGAQAHLVRFERDEAFSQVMFEVRGEASTNRRDAPLPLPPNPRMEVTGLEDALTSRLLMEGGAMRGFQSASMDGRPVGFQEAAQAMNFWAFNGTIGMPDEPLFIAEQGRTVRVAMQNDTMFPHAMHLHGHHFREVLPGGGLGPLRDTLLVLGDESREIAFVAHTPGEWVFHCHMLTHAASGMMTRFRVTA
ncbi:Multicopper oxidase with three cupredoxin domains (includes cell division protein FtsP and spore coat protein CotA) [Tropicimonas isoalkanivorans]|uniref:Multicopper oxidase with three cupredoxin domains (Includes cell division protein FtsP and spore coat protein CotA) n=2 Tax=Tropicimonas isoalkanivorans TaxID=441112 RepID=A0A1I1N2M9_9RHOB|nr:Multicopper oxidase with three cupredoxin domains (includes cell division protein FtsP and spore coat protein CotA) [Tropicimonas isoalkanivorans]